MRNIAITSKYHGFAAGLVGLFLFAAHTAAAQPDGRAGQQPPNVIFIMADDLGYGDLGAYGQEQIKTPHLDEMAREGTVFTQFYAGSTVCAPSRYALMTGQHTGHAYARGNVGWERGDVPLQPRDTTIGEMLEQAGYTNGVYGKWALGLKGTTGAPHRSGFEAFLGYEDQSEAHNYYVDRLQGIEHGVTVNVDVDTTQYTHDLFAEAALHFIEQNRAEPFFLYLPFTLPHADLAVPKASLQAYLNEDGKSVFDEPTSADQESYHANSMPYATYAAMVSHLDRSVGQILDRLEALGMAKNTVVFFTSDNGPHSEGGYDMAYFDSNGPLRGMKRDLYEGGIRVPMIAWGPGRVPAGRRSDQVWAAWDVLPTLADLAGMEPPSGGDGLSMASAVTGQGTQKDHEHLYWEFYGGETAQAVRMGRWKGVRRPMMTGSIELYDLKTDRAEEHNVAGQHPEVVDRIRHVMEEAHTPSALFKAPPEKQ